MKHIKKFETYFEKGGLSDTYNFNNPYETSGIVTIKMDNIPIENRCTIYVKINEQHIPNKVEKFEMDSHVYYLINKGDTVMVIYELDDDDNEKLVVMGVGNEDYAVFYKNYLND